ncbi:MAG: hypothetical protein DRI48_02755 [Chloroflexi bacterium]|nr:MAG: hypothetical protein DRI48_02755 [Chloroflexota bacterium]
MSETPGSILTARVVSIRYRLIGSMCVILVVLLAAGILYAISLSNLSQVIETLEKGISQAVTLTPEQQAAVLAESEAARRAMWEIPLAWGLALVIATLSTTLITLRSIAQPAQRLTEAARSLSRGNLEERVEIEWVDEFGRIATAFNQMADQLQSSYAELEQQIAERTLELEQHSAQLEMTAQIARQAAAIQDVERLLPQTVHLISDRFSFYHVGIFLVDETREYAVLRAASSEGGQRMLAQQHRLKVGEEGIVGYVTAQGQPRISLDVGTEAVSFDNPHLPRTRSQVVLPLRARGEIIGALDIQSGEAEAFTPDDVTVLQTLADQVALAIDNARLLQQAQESLEAERRAYGELRREAWAELLRTQPNLGQRYDPQGILPVGPQWDEEATTAVLKGKTALNQDKPFPALATPIKIQDQIIGVLDAHKPAEAGGWTAEEIALLETLADQLAVALEGARLHQDAQRRAEREHLISEVTTRVRETLDMDTVLQTAVREMRQALGLHDVMITLETTNGHSQDTAQPPDQQNRSE